MQELHYSIVPGGDRDVDTSAWLYRTTDAMPFILICRTLDQGSIPSGAFERACVLFYAAMHGACDAASRYGVIELLFDCIYFQARSRPIATFVYIMYV